MNDNKVALITGGSRGIGEKIAERFAQAGYNLIINYVSFWRCIVSSAG